MMWSAQCCLLGRNEICLGNGRILWWQTLDNHLSEDSAVILAFYFNLFLV